MVADALSRAADNFVQYRRQHELDFKIVLAIHDSMLFLVPNSQLDDFLKRVIPACMESVPIYPCYLDGMPKEGVTEPYYLKTDTEIHQHWGEHMYPHECWERGYSEELAGWQKSDKFGEKWWECSAIPEKAYNEQTRQMVAFFSDKSGKHLLLPEAIELAKRLNRYPQPEPGVDVNVYLKKMKKKLIEHLVNEEGVFLDPSQSTAA